MNTAKKKNRKPFKSKTVLATVLFLALAVCIVSFALGPKDYRDFLDALGARESSDNYRAENRYGYLGRYQLGAMALQDAGFMDQNGIWTERANSCGVYSESDFLNSPAAQETAVTAYHKQLCRYIRSLALEQYVGKEYCGVEITASGLLAACHLVGVRSMRAALASDEMVYDGNGVSAASYMEQFAGYDISVVWGG